MAYKIFIMEGDENMKVLRNVCFLTVLSFVFLAICVFAQTTVSWGPVELSSYSGIYYSNIYTKNADYCTAIYKTKAVDAITGGGRAISARVETYDAGAPSAGNWLTNISTGQWESWGTKSNDCYATSARINLKASTSTLAKTKFYGTWNLKYALNGDQ